MEVPDPPRHRQGLSVGGPVRSRDPVAELPGRAARQRDPGESARPLGGRTQMTAEQERDLAERRDRGDGGVRQRETHRIAPVGPRREDADGIAVPRRGIDDRPAVRGESRRLDAAALERQTLEVERRILSRSAQKKERSGSHDKHGGGREEGRHARTAARPDAEAGGRHARRVGHVVPEDLELAREVPRRRIALGGVLGQAALHEPAQGTGNPRLQLPDRLGLLVEDRGQRIDAGPALKRSPPRRHLVQDRSECELIGSVIDRGSLSLLGRHVAHGPDDDSGEGVRLHRGRRVRAARAGRQQFR